MSFIRLSMRPRRAASYVGFCCERSNRMRLWGQCRSSIQMEQWPHNRSRLCARRQQASLGRRAPKLPVQQQALLQVRN